MDFSADAPQIKNFKATVEHTKVFQPALKTQDKDVISHQKALQALSNGDDVPYQASLRVVGNEGNRAPMLPPQVTMKHPGT